MFSLDENKLIILYSFQHFSSKATSWLVGNETIPPINEPENASNILKGLFQNYDKRLRPGHGGKSYSMFVIVHNCAWASVEGGEWSFKIAVWDEIFRQIFYKSRRLIFLEVLCFWQSRFFSHKAVSEFHFFARLRKSPSPNLFAYFSNTSEQLESLNALSSNLKHFEVSVSKLKRRSKKWLRLTKNTASLAFSHSLAFKIHHPYTRDGMGRNTRKWFF